MCKTNVGLLVAASVLACGCSGAPNTDLFARAGADAGADGAGTGIHFVAPDKGAADSGPDGGTAPSGSPDNPPSPDDAGALPADAAVGPACTRDSDCMGTICNIRLGQCAAPQGAGGPCERDDECAGGLCNL